jgi:hypothetical protein
MQSGGFSLTEIYPYQHRNDQLPVNVILKYCIEIEVHSQTSSQLR